MKRLYLVLGIIAIVAVASTVTQRSVVTAIGVDIVSTYVAEPLPTKDVTSSLWQRALATDVPLSGQQTTQPMAMDSSVRSVSIRSLNNGEHITFLLEWADEAKDVGGGVSTYRDSVALQFPVAESGDPFSGFTCMGVGIGGGETVLVDIIHWRSDFQRDIEEGFTDVQDIFPNIGISLYPDVDPIIFRPAEAVGNQLANRSRSTPIERLYAEGFGTLESKESVDASGWGQWQEGKWKVVITRPLASDDSLNSQLEPEQVTTLAIAAWDGGNQEIDGKKSVSSWITAEIQGVRTDISLYSIIIPILLALTAALIITLALRRILLSLQDNRRHNALLKKHGLQI